MVFKFCMNGYLQYLKPALRPGGIRSNRRCLLNGPGQARGSKAVQEQCRGHADSSSPDSGAFQPGDKVVLSKSWYFVEHTKTTSRSAPQNGSMNRDLACTRRVQKICELRLVVNTSHPYIT